MNHFIYLKRDDKLSHAYVSPYADRKKSDLSRRSNRFARNENLTFFRKPSAGYKSKYYDPEARHERYLREKTHSTRPYGSGSKSLGGKGSKGSGAAKNGRGGGGATKKNVSDAIAKIYEESSLDTEAHREAARRKIEDLRSQLKAYINKLQESRSGENNEINVTEIRANIQNIREQIEATGADLQKWIDEEREALQRRIAKLSGEDYDKKKLERQTAVKNKEKEISSRADAIYKSKSRK